MRHKHLMTNSEGTSNLFAKRERPLFETKIERGSEFSLHSTQIIILVI